VKSLGSTNPEHADVELSLTKKLSSLGSRNRKHPAVNKKFKSLGSKNPEHASYEISVSKKVIC